MISNIFNYLNSTRIEAPKFSTGESKTIPVLPTDILKVICKKFNAPETVLFGHATKGLSSLVSIDWKQEFFILTGLELKYKLPAASVSIEYQSAFKIVYLWAKKFKAIKRASDNYDDGICCAEIISEAVKVENFLLAKTIIETLEITPGGLCPALRNKIYVHEKVITRLSITLKDLFKKYAACNDITKAKIALTEGNAIGDCSYSRLPRYDLLAMIRGATGTYALGEFLTEALNARNTFQYFFVKNLEEFSDEKIDETVFAALKKAINGFDDDKALWLLNLKRRLNLKNKFFKWIGDALGGIQYLERATWIFDNVYNSEIPYTTEELATILLKVFKKGKHSLLETIRVFSFLQDLFFERVGQPLIPFELIDQILNDRVSFQHIDLEIRILLIKMKSFSN